MPPLFNQSLAISSGDLLVDRLRRVAPVDGDDVEAFSALARDRVVLPVERSLFDEGAEPRHLHVLREGWAARVKLLPDGRRHLCALLLPGDVCDVDGLHLPTYDYGVVALTACTVARAERGAVRALCVERPRLADVLACLASLDASILNEAALSLARRSARQRLAHLLCELKFRLEAIGRFCDDGYDLPLTQDRLADALGLTAVHVSRSLKQLRATGLIATADRRVISRDWDRLGREALFRPAYLHLGSGFIDVGGAI